MVIYEFYANIFSQYNVITKNNRIFAIALLIIVV